MRNLAGKVETLNEIALLHLCLSESYFNCYCFFLPFPFWPFFFPDRR